MLLPQRIDRFFEVLFGRRGRELFNRPVLIVFDPEGIEEIAKNILMRADEPDLEKMRSDGVVCGTPEGVLHPGVAFRRLFALDEHRTKTALLRQRFDRGLIQLALVPVQMGEQVVGQFRVKAGEDLVRLKHWGADGRRRVRRCKPCAQPTVSDLARSPMTSAARTPIKSLSLTELGDRLAALEQPSFRAKQVAEWIYVKRVKSFEAMTNLPAALRKTLAEAFSFDALETVRVLGSEDTTRKFLFRLEDGSLIESVLIPASPALYGEASDRRTLCVSTQVGCAYGCKFCASGLDGWSRNLLASEIVEQILKVEEASGERVNNLVFMGMGEPLANFTNVMRAIEILNAPWGVGIGARHITLSTSGLAPQIRQLADQPLQVRLAISLHGAIDEVRQQIMPVNKKYPLNVLLEACEYYASKKKQRLTFEYILIENVNDRPQDATALARIARRANAKVNCIPYNTVEGLPWKRPSERRQDEFMAILDQADIPATIRREKGHDISAACGQLRRQTMQAPAE